MDGPPMDHQLHGGSPGFWGATGAPMDHQDPQNPGAQKTYEHSSTGTHLTPENIGWIGDL